MKLAIFIVFFFISNSVIGNSVDSIQTDSDVLAFLKRIDNRFTSDKYRQLQIFPTPTIRQKLNCDSIAEKWNINNWEKVDFNGDNKTDLIVTTYWYNFDVFVAIDNGDNTYKIIKLSKDEFQNCELAKPIKINSEQLLLFYRIRYEYAEQPENMFDFNAKSRIDTLIYKYGGFIEKNKLASYDISEIEYYTSSGWTGISPVYKLKILRNGNATFEAISDSPKKIIPPTKANKDTVQSIVDLIQHVNIKTLKNKYQVTWFDDTTIYLKIIFRDRTIKEIEDYGMIGTFGLNQLYQLLFSLNKKADK
jgi:hypothetical protein